VLLSLRNSVTLRRCGGILWGSVFLALGVQALAAIGSPTLEPSTPTGDIGAGAPANLRKATDKPAPAVVVRNITLKAAEPIDTGETATLSFDLYNNVDARVTDIVLSISFVDDREDVPPPV